MSILNKIVSSFESCIDTEPVSVNLLDWLLNSKHTTLLEKVRQIEDKQKRDILKKQLPAITPSGEFGLNRLDSSLITHSGLIAIDIDLKENWSIQNYGSLKSELAKLINIAYCGLSASGKGYWALIPIKYPEKHAEHFEFIRQYFENKGLVIDSQCKNVGRLRIYSYDADAHFNHEARPLEQYIERKHNGNARVAFDKSSSNEVVDFLITKIVELKIDITEGYDRWRNIGFGLASEYKEGGRQLYHLVSANNLNYNFQETDRQYDNCLRNARQENGITIASIIHYCKEFSLLHPATSKNHISRGLIQAAIAPALSANPTVEDTEHVVIFHNSTQTEFSESVKAQKIQHEDTREFKRKESQIDMTSNTWEDHLSSSFLERILKYSEITTSVKLNPWTQAIPSIMIPSHISAVKHSANSKTAAPYISRLKELANHFGIEA